MHWNNNLKEIIPQFNILIKIKKTKIIIVYIKFL